MVPWLLTARIFELRLVNEFFHGQSCTPEVNMHTENGMITQQQSTPRIWYYSVPDTMPGGGVSPVANKDIHEFQSSTDYLSAPVPVTGELPVG
jgi:hypothetical protein